MTKEKGTFEQDQTSAAAEAYRNYTDRLIGGLEEFLKKLEQDPGGLSIQSKVRMINYLSGGTEEVNHCDQETINNVRSLVEDIQEKFKDDPLYEIMAKILFENFLESLRQ